MSLLKKKKKFIFYSKNTDNNDKFPNKNNIKQSAIITSEDKENNSFRIDKNNIYQTSKKQKRRISELFLGPKDIFSNRINDVNESNQIGARILNNNAFENFATIKKNRKRRKRFTINQSINFTSALGSGYILIQKINVKRQKMKLKM
jgi:hypothetical protein